MKINGKKASTGSYINLDDRIDLFEEVQNHPVYKLKVEVVYEDDFFAVVNKPSGLKISGNEHQNLQNCLTFNLTPSSQRDALVYPRPAHRLDKSTSGLVLVAKTYSYLRHFLDLFSKREIEKEYVAIVEGEIDKEGEITSPVDGKEALTNFERLESFNSVKNDCLSLVKLNPKTGRKHQLRKHLSGIGKAIVGDSLYNLDGKLKHKGLFLCARKISFHLPDNKVFTTEIKLPIKFESLINREKEWYQRISDKRILKDFVNQSEVLIDLLNTIDKVSSEIYISAGCIRNTYWDKKYDEKNSLNDVDVIYHGDTEDEIRFENELKRLNPGFKWSVKNQARMHLKHGHNPYQDINEAISYWPEKATAVAIRKVNNDLEIISPYGLQDIFEGRISKSPKTSETTYKKRLNDKQWLKKWPKLLIS